MSGIPGELFKKVTTPGDLSAFLLGFGAGFAADAFAWLGGVPTVDPLTAGLAGGAGALGVKQGLQGAVEATMHRRRLQNRARRLLSFAKSPRYTVSRDLLSDLVPALEAAAELITVDVRMAESALDEVDAQLTARLKEIAAPSQRLIVGSQ